MSNYTWVLSLISIFLVFFTWGVVYFNAKRIATRSETKSLIDSVIKSIEVVSDTSVDFWLTMKDDNKIYKVQKHNLLISSKLAQLSSYFQFIKARGVCLSDTLLAQINDKATLESEKAPSFDDLESAVKAQEIKEICTLCIEHVFEEFEKTHPPSSHKTLFQRLRDLNKYLEDWSRSLGHHHN